MKKGSSRAERFVSVILTLGMLFGLIAPVGVVNASVPDSVDLNVVQSTVEKSPLADVDPGNIWAWGYDHFNQLGVTSTRICYGYACVDAPTQIDGYNYMIDVVAGLNHTLALREDGTVWAWGLNDVGQLGAPTTEDCGGSSCSTVPVQVPGLYNVVAIAAGDFHSLALKSDGTVWGWGANSTGQLGGTTGENCSSTYYYSNTVCRRSPTQVSGVSNIVAISGGFAHSLALKDDGTVWSWGWNDFGTLGRASADMCGANSLDMCDSTPAPIEGIDNVTAIDAGGANSIALTSDNTVWTWGINSRGQLGTATAPDTCIWSDNGNSYPCSLSPLPVLSGVTKIATSKNGVDQSYGFSLALKNDGSVWSWGPNSYGQLGDNTTTNRAAPNPVIGLSNVTEIAAGYWHGLALKDDGTTWAWGRNEYGQIGDLTTTQRLTPVQITVPENILGLRAGRFSSFLFVTPLKMAIFSINGTVLDDQTPPEPIPGVTISYTVVDPAMTITTASNGTYTIMGAPANSTGQLIAEKIGYAFNGPIDVAPLTAALGGQDFIGTRIAPTAVDDSYDMNEDAVLVVDPATGVLSNDTDIDSPSMTANKVTGPAHGILTLNGDGSFTYTPNADFSGTDSFTYIANDGTYDSDIATVTITVNNINDAPIANDDEYTIIENTLLEVPAPGILINDDDADPLDTLTSTNLTETVNGVLTLNGDGSFSYTPNVEFNGSDSFTYSINDGTIDSNVATVTITIDPFNDPPVATEDSYTTNEDESLIVAIPGVLGNDNDVDSSTITAIKVDDPTHGSLTLNNSGSFVYTPIENYHGQDSFSYKAYDGEKASNTVTVTITVESVNDAPIAENDSGYSLDEDTSLTIAAPGVLFNDTDADLDPLTASEVTGPANGDLILKSDGSFTYTPSPNYNGLDSFTYTANDGVDNSNAATVSITIRPVKDITVAVDDYYHTTLDQALNVPTPGVIINDSNVDQDVLTAIKLSDPLHGELTFNDDGSFIYTPLLGYYGTDSFTYKLNNQMEDSNIATVNIIVNRLPVAVDDNGTVYTTDEDTPLIVPAPGILGNDNDPDNDPLYAIKATDPANGTLVLAIDGSFTYTPNANFNGSDSFTYRANDGLNDSNLSTVSITVNSLNDIPVATDDSYAAGWGIPLIIPAPGVMENDTDADGDPLTAIQKSSPSHGELIFNNDGSFSYTSAVDYIGQDIFTYLINDGEDNSNIATVTFDVSDVNRLPVVENKSYTIMVDEVLVIPAPGLLENATDIDSDPLTAVKGIDPANGTVVISADGSFTYTPNLDFSGIDTFTYMAFDTQDNSIPATVTVTVNRDPNAPTAVDDVYTTPEDVSKTVYAKGYLKNDTDPAQKSLYGVLITGPAHGRLVFYKSGYFTYKPYANFNGTDSFTYRANNRTFNSNIATVTINVTPRNDQPKVKSDKFSVEMNNSLKVDSPGVLVNDYDVDGDPLKVILIQKPYHGKLTLNLDGSFEYIPNVNYAGNDYFIYRIKDATLYSSYATVSISVTRPVYTFTGFFDPVIAQPTRNRVTAGASIPIRFSLSGDRGPIISPLSSPSSVRVSCSGSAPVVDIAETSVESAGLTYDSATDQYTYVWSTSRTWAGTCRKFSLKLNDLTVHTALFKFQK